MTPSAMPHTSRIKTKVARRIEEFPAQDWNKVFPETLENYFFCKTLDESHFDQFSFFYIMVYEGDVPIGAAPCFTMRFPLDITVAGPFKAVVDAVKKVLPAVLNPKALICGLPMGQGRIGMAGDRQRVMRAIHDSLETLARREKASMIFFKDFTGEYDDLLGPFLKKGFFKIEGLPNTDMRVRFRSFEEFLKTLSPVSRSGIKRKFKQIDGKVKFDLDIVTHLDEAALSEVHGLYLQTVRKNDDGLEIVPKEFFRNISRNMPQQVKYFLWRKDRNMVAFALCLVSAGDCIDYYLGFDYAVAYQYHLYFVRFRDLMEWCIAHGIKRYEMGQTGYEPKKRLGFDYIRLYYYIRHRNALLNFACRTLSPLFKPDNFDPVFKDMEAARERT